jgi:hypothetical protein
MPVDGEGRIGGEEGGVLDEVLGELYIFLMKESNMMLNMAYTNTIIERYCNTVQGRDLFLWFMWCSVVYVVYVVFT